MTTSPTTQPAADPQPVAHVEIGSSGSIRWRKGLMVADLVDGAPLYTHPPAAPASQPATWRDHDNTGMRFPEDSDLTGGATDCAPASQPVAWVTDRADRDIVDAALKAFAKDPRRNLAARERANAMRSSLAATPPVQPAPEVPAPQSLLRKPVKSISEISAAIPGGCHCPPDRCSAPVIMGRQTPCLRRPISAGNAAPPASPEAAGEQQEQKP